jgi:hypothetical protein
MGIPLLFTEEFEVVIMIDVVTEKMRRFALVEDVCPSLRRIACQPVLLRPALRIGASFWTSLRWSSCPCRLGARTLVGMTRLIAILLSPALQSGK